MDILHTPVMPAEVVTLLRGSGHHYRFVDGTIGTGGHAERLLQSSDDAHLLGIDCDREAIACSRRRLARFGDRVRLAHGRFENMSDYARALGWQTVDGVLLDLGICSAQLDQPLRGFSHRIDGPLDMRLDTSATVTAAMLLNTKSEAELTDIFRIYGEERQARQVARAAVERRPRRPWERTGEFAELVSRIVGYRRKGSLPPATRCFQALRITVNDELNGLSRGLCAAVNLLHPGGRLVVISFHSLEDRIVKRFFREQAAPCRCPPRLPVCVCGKQAAVRILTRKPLRPTEAEVGANRRAAPARLRAAERL